MQEIYVVFILYGILAIWFIDNLISFLHHKKASIIMIITHLLTVIFMFIYYYIFLDLVSIEIVSIIVLGIMFFSKVFLQSLYNKSTTKEGTNPIILNQKLELLDNEFEELRHRFIAMIDIVGKGVLFEDKRGLYASPKLTQMISLDLNSFSKMLYEQLIHKEDIDTYLKSKKKLSKDHSKFEIKYRLYINHSYIWVKEIGQYISLNNDYTIISLVELNEPELFMKSEVEVLNQLPSYKEMYSDLNNVSKLGSVYYFVQFKLSNIPLINEQKGRDVGDLMMGEFIKKLHHSVSTYKKKIYRISGINFAFIIDDAKEFTLFERALQKSGDLLNFRIQFGGLDAIIYPNFGISEQKLPGKSIEIVIKEAKDALDLSIDDPLHNNFCFYDRVN
jgi:GGDEF domain-containing protein